MIETPDFTRQFAIVLCFIILILIIILILYYNSTKNIVDITEEIFTNTAHSINNKKKDIPIKKCNQKDILALFNEFEEIVLSDKILNNNLIESYVIYIYFESAFGDKLWLDNFYKEKNILRRDKFRISYKPSTNQLVVTVPIKKLGITSSNNQEESYKLNHSEEKIYVNGIKLQKWLQVGVILNGRTVDIYIDKRLRKSQILDNIPILSNEKIIIGEKYKNPNCYIGKIQYSPIELKVDELKALYFRYMSFFKIDPLLRDCIYYNNHILKTYNPNPPPTNS